MENVEMVESAENHEIVSQLHNVDVENFISKKIALWTEQQI